MSQVRLSRGVVRSSSFCSSHTGCNTRLVTSKNSPFVPPSVIFSIADQSLCVCSLSLLNRWFINSGSDLPMSYSEIIRHLYPVICVAWWTALEHTQVASCGCVTLSSSQRWCGTCRAYLGHGQTERETHGRE